MKSMSAARTLVVLTAILAAHLSLLLHCALRKSACFDEGAHLAAGLAYLKHGEMSIYNLSPPLVRMWAALPAYLHGARIPPGKPLRDEPARRRHWIYFERFQQQNLAAMHRYVLWGRLMLIPLSLMVAGSVFLWASRLYGKAAGLLCCAVWSFSPTVIAHGSTLGTDMPLALGMLLSVGLWWRFVGGGRKRDALLGALAIGLTHTIKFTALLLWPIVFGIALFEVLQRRARWRQCLAGGAIALLVTFVLLNAVYGFRRMGHRLDSFDFASRPMRWVAGILPGAVPVPFHQDMVEGFDAQTWEAQGVYVAVLFDQAYFGNDWRYYPWLLVTKSTLGGLVLLAAGLLSLAIRRPGAPELPLIALIAGLALGVGSIAQINIGIRYLLPAYAPAMILLGRVAEASSRRTILLVAAALAAAAESIHATPRFHSFTNLAADRWRWCVPDLDWGQSLIELRDWMNRQAESQICLLYVGTADPAAYGIRISDPFSVPTTRYIAFSRAALQGIPCRLPQGFAFVRPWRMLRSQISPAADLEGLLVYRVSDLESIRQPWVVRISDWQQALEQPELIAIRNLHQRARNDG
ncbi:ArnT family glycosyltransferase [Fontivita pretiosa]|uniref:ArnT family glycosyltransferase n=1 Tax=Fontivita pretiosa TaxID=2989684 RepID=UPI003D167B29